MLRVIIKLSHVKNNGFQIIFLETMVSPLNLSFLFREVLFVDVTNEFIQSLNKSFQNTDYMLGTILSARDPQWTIMNMKTIANEKFLCLIEEFGFHSQNTNLKHGCGFSSDPV